MDGFKGYLSRCFFRVSSATRIFILRYPSCVCVCDIKYVIIINTYIGYGETFIIIYIRAEILAETNNYERLRMRPLRTQQKKKSAVQPFSSDDGLLLYCRSH